jgi:hypothetical protein
VRETPVTTSENLVALNVPKQTGSPRELRAGRSHIYVLTAAYGAARSEKGQNAQGRDLHQIHQRVADLHK